MYKLFEAAAAMRLTSGCHARCSSFVLKSMEVPSAGAAGAAAADSRPPPGLAAAPFCSAARFALLLPLDSPNLPCDWHAECTCRTSGKTCKVACEPKQDSSASTQGEKIVFWRYGTLLPQPK